MKTISSSIYLAFVAVMLASMALLPQVQAVSPTPDGCYSGFTTAEGCDALSSLTTGNGNTAVGWRSLFSDSTGSFNTGLGAGTLVLNNADSNTAVGAGALLLNTTGMENTAIGTGTLVSNDNGGGNTAVGAFALENNINGGNTAVGTAALQANTTGIFNVAVGNSALQNNTTGHDNIALGFGAGHEITTGGSFNIDIGNLGVAGDSGVIRIGDSAEQGQTFLAGVYGVSVAGLQVVMNSSNQLGTTASSRRFKEDIKPMDKASKALFALKPVTFHYKKEIDPERKGQLGLVAEDVEKVNPDLVVRDKEGKPYSVRYDQVNAMLLNEFLKEHRKVEEQEATIAQVKSNAAMQEATLAEQKATITELKSGMQALTATVKEQASQIQKVSAQLEASKPAPQVVNNP